MTLAVSDNRALRRRHRRRRHLRTGPCAGGGAARQARRRHRPRRAGQRRLDPQFRLRHGDRPGARQDLGAGDALARDLARGRARSRHRRSCIAASPWWRAPPEARPCSRLSCDRDGRKAAAARRRRRPASAFRCSPATTFAGVLIARTSCGSRAATPFPRLAPGWRRRTASRFCAQTLRPWRRAAGDRDEPRHRSRRKRDRLPGRRSPDRCSPSASPPTR